MSNLEYSRQPNSSKPTLCNSACVFETPISNHNQSLLDSKKNNFQPTLPGSHTRHMATRCNRWSTSRRFNATSVACNTELDGRGDFLAVKCWGLRSVSPFFCKILCQSKYLLVMHRFTFLWMEMVHDQCITSSAHLQIICTSHVLSASQYKYLIVHSHCETVDIETLQNTCFQSWFFGAFEHSL